MGFTCEECRVRHSWTEESENHPGFCFDCHRAMGWPMTRNMAIKLIEELAWEHNIEVNISVSQQ